MSRARARAAGALTMAAVLLVAAPPAPAATAQEAAGRNLGQNAARSAARHAARNGDRNAAQAALVAAQPAPPRAPGVAPAPPPPIPAAEYGARRQRVAEAIGPDGLLLLVSPAPAPRNGDVTWPFRQDDDLLYLTGAAGPRTALAMLPGEERYHTVLFAPDADPLDELWTGPVPSHEELAAATGIEEVVSIEELPAFLAAALSGRAWGESDLYRYYSPPAVPRFSQAVAGGRATVWLDLGNRAFGSGGAFEPLWEAMPGSLRLAGEVRELWPEAAIRNATPLLVELREVKSPAELALLRHAIAITEQGILAGMRRALTAERENQVQAALEATFRDLGACCWGFPSIVGAGPNATILHYEQGEDPVPRDGLVLLDVGAEYRGYTADVTRTFPADGTFSPEQRAVYTAVLDVWQAMLPRFRPGAVPGDLHEEALRLMGDELLELGLVSENVREQASTYFPHGLGHPLGLQVHDVFDNQRPFEPGMVWTLEPGLYVRRGDVEASGWYGELGAAERRRVDAELARYAGLGVRIEDDLLVTSGAPEVLSDGAPRTVEAIEAAMRPAR